MKIVFATNNKNKIAEVRKMLDSKYEVMSLEDIGCHENIPETGKCLRENAWQKASYVFEKYGFNCFADDTGLEVEALNGEPGVYSARYAGGKGHDSEANMAKLLKNLEGIENRKARFCTDICLILRNNDHADVRFFEGIVDGEIIKERRGGEGFGYDPIFQPNGYTQTFAELGSNIKNNISHRAKAVEKLAEYLARC